MSNVTNGAIAKASHRKKIHDWIVVIILLVLLITAFTISANTGTIRLSPMELFRTLFGQGTPQQELILFEFRLPRMVISILIGAGLAVSGCIMQGVSRNSLADPGILGINAGAGLMVMLFVLLFPSMQTMNSLFLLPALALIGSGAAAILIYALSYKKGEGISPTRLLLSGIGVAAGISAAMIIMTLKLTPESYTFVANWLAGSIWGSNWKFVMALLPWLIVLLPFAYYKANVMNVLNLGDQTASGLGTPIEKERILLLAAAVGLASSSVSVSGGIGFVGLVAPHLARKLVGPKHKMLLVTCALVGALLVLVADTITRALPLQKEIPTGLIVAIIGAPYFLYLLSRSKG
ncbi:FecCD family ABC transporter permease [Paenibacillus polymyxa]|uniref:FecCD family ABC transporter permease n=1 Tax=Paenibacillus polymyxa TaxID=1406 RepID=UPI00296EF14B|nr:iron ABC transporter permease [Paenibacillus polymyxa]WOZ36304.1 iron ABC transporter permease [Paenibacillus polymyxa]